MKKVKLSNNFSIAVEEYANQGNAFLGIRESGKTYSATKAAEQLMDADIPIIAFDPVGIWKNLKVGVNGHNGYPVVTAGGADCDIRLTKENAVDIVRAAMKENVNLVIDLYSRELATKATWIKIVHETIDMLLYENKGLRHIFIEEAAEFIPQVIQPQQRLVYSTIEKLARIGRNSGLGYTIINQRPEEVNKAILELCALSFMHKQVGKNSMKSIKLWMDLLQIENSDVVLKSLPRLTSGECWVFGQHANPVQIKVSPKNTFHPNPKAAVSRLNPPKAKKGIDVTAFVDKIKKTLEADASPILHSPLPQAGIPVKLHPDYKKLQNDFYELQQTNHVLNSINEVYAGGIEKILGHIKGIMEVVDAITLKKQIHPKEAKISKIVNETVNTANKIVATLDKGPTEPPANQLGRCAKYILRFLAQYPDRSWTKVQIAIYTGYSPNSGGFKNAISELRKYDLITGSDRLMVNRLPNLKDFTGDFQPQNYGPEVFMEKLGKCEREIFTVVLNSPNTIYQREVMADKTGYSVTSGGFKNSISKLNSLELIVKHPTGIQLNPELTALMN